MRSVWQSADTSVQVVQVDESHDKQTVETLLRFFERVAAQEGWQPGEALNRWRAGAVYFALEVDEQLAGGLQLVLPDAAGVLPYDAVWPEIATPTNQCAHVTILALADGFRGQGTLFWTLVVEMWRYCVAQGITTLFIEVTPRVLPLYQRLGWPLHVCGELRTHWGEDCYLCAFGIPSVAEVLLSRSARSRLYRQVVAHAFRLALPERAPERVAV